eukprot:jgi/Hompol1/2998/HPOL_006306-RA
MSFQDTSLDELLRISEAPDITASSTVDPSASTFLGLSSGSSSLLRDIFGQEQSDEGLMDFEHNYSLDTASSSTHDPFGGMVGGLDNINDVGNEPAVQEPLVQKARQGSTTNSSSVFGFGSFDAVFLSDIALESAKDKLPEDEHITNEQVLISLRNQLLAFRCGSSDEKPGIAECHEGFDLSSTLCIHQIQFGDGRLQSDSQNNRILWTGMLSGNDDPVCLAFDLGKIGQIQAKEIDGINLINYSVAETTFLQFIVAGMPDAHHQQLQRS